jgi:hypothetical protein
MGKASEIQRMTINAAMAITLLAGSGNESGLYISYYPFLLVTIAFDL